MRSPSAFRSRLIGCLGSALALTAFADTPRAPDALEARIAEHARRHLLAEARQAGHAQPQVEVTAVLPRAQSPAATDCPRPLDIEVLDARHPGRMLLAAVCDGAERAQFVVRAQVSAPVVVAAAELESGRTLEAVDVKLERRALGGDTLADPGEVVGKTLRRAVRSGEPIERRWLHEPILVRRGDAVTIVARRSGVEAQVAG